MNFKQLREFALLWADTDGFKERALEAQAIIHQAIKIHEKIYVSYSGGKDSTVMTHLVLAQKPDIMVHHYDYGQYMPREFEREICRNAFRLGVREFKIERGSNWYRAFFGRIAPQYIREGYTAVFVGIRKEESLKRKRRIKSKRDLTSRIKEYWPLQNWCWQDVWAYIFLYNLPIHSAYLKYGPLIGWNQVRFVTFFDPEFEKLGAPQIDGVLTWRHRNAPKRSPE